MLWKMKHCLDRAALWITGGQYSKSLTSFLERSPQNISKGSSKKAQADCATHPGQGSPVLFLGAYVHMWFCCEKSIWNAWLFTPRMAYQLVLQEVVN